MSPHSFLTTFCGKSGSREIFLWSQNLDLSSWEMFIEVLIDLNIMVSCWSGLDHKLFLKFSGFSTIKSQLYKTIPKCVLKYFRKVS